MKGTSILALSILLMLFAASTVWPADESFFDRHEVSIGYSFYTVHFSGEYRGNGEKYNNANHIVILSMDQWFASTFVNSHYNRSYAFGYTFRTPKWRPFNNDVFGRLNLKAGLVYGYEDDLFNIGGFTPGAIPGIEIGYKQFSIDTGIVPIGDGVMSCVFTYTF